MNRHPSLPPEDLPLAEASVQEIQLELIRRQRWNSLDGPKIVASLRAHRKLWRAALMDNGEFMCRLLKLRDLPRNSWNVDHLYVLTESEDQANELKRIAEEEQWKVDNIMVYRNHDERMRLLGTSHPGFVVSFWWD